MAALVFPTSPTVGQVYSANGRSWSWDGYTWNIVSGASAAPSFIGCRVYNSTTQTVNDSSSVALTFDTETYDNGGNHSTGSNTDRITIPAGGAGYYAGLGGGAWDSNTTGVRIMWWMKNGAAIAGSESRMNAAGTGGQQASLPPVYLAAGDYLQLLVFQNSGGARTIGHAATEQYRAGIAVWKIDGIVGPSGTIANGTAFPASPTTNQRFFRTDLGLDCYYDGTRWLTVNEYELPLVVGDALMLRTTNGNPVSGSVNPSQAGVWVVRWYTRTYVETTNSGTDYWTLQLKSRNSAVASTNVGSSVNTSAIAVGTFASQSVTVGAALAAGALDLTVTVTKTNAPGGILINPVVVYRLIVT